MDFSYKALARGIAVTLVFLLICVAIIASLVEFTCTTVIGSPAAGIANDPGGHAAVVIDRMQVDLSAASDVITPQPILSSDPDQQPDFTYMVISDRANALDKHPVLVENPDAHDPTYQELVEFLSTDDTVNNKYVNPDFTCADFAAELQNHAESQGIQCGYTGLNFVGKDNGHAIDVFNTVDEGLVYVDTTGGKVHINKNLQVGNPYYNVGTIASIKNYW